MLFHYFLPYKIIIIPEEGWFGQPKYSTHKKDPSTLCRLLLLFSSFLIFFYCYMTLLFSLDHSTIFSPAARDFRARLYNAAASRSSPLGSDRSLAISISINLLVVYRESVNLIGYITRRLSAVSKIQLVVYYQYCVLIG